MNLIRQMNGGLAPKLLVIIPDGAMHGLPFAALRDATTNRYLIEQTPIAIAGSTRLFLYSSMRDVALRKDGAPRIAAFGDPAADRELMKAEDLDRLPAAQSEAENIFARYDNLGALKIDKEATISEFLSLAPSSDIIHFAGHAVANAETPFKSHLLFARDQEHSGVLTAAEILAHLEKLDKTRLVVLGACSSAGGSSVGPEGMAPLVRPFIAANVPAVIGSLWNVGDATTKQLLVSFHRHYRNGDDVTAALQKAQLEMLRKDDVEPSSALAWGAFQVIGYASSPFVSSARTEERQSEHVHSQNSLQRHDGLHPR
jgi:CHAT domain-containing protein